MRKLLGSVLSVMIALTASAQWVNPADDIPAYYSVIPKRPSRPVLSGQQLTGPYFSHDYQVAAYKMAAQIPAVLHQQPCYCRCDRQLRHKSLHTCFEGTHGATCATCMKEAVFSYQQTKLGRTPGQIRSAIERGDWMSVDLAAAAL